MQRDDASKAMGHTPGPWRPCTASHRPADGLRGLPLSIWGAWRRSKDGKRWNRCTPRWICRLRTSGLPKAELQANGALIAAAPHMRKALLEITYKRAGRYYIGLKADADVTDIVAPALADVPKGVAHGT